LYFATWLVTIGPPDTQLLLTLFLTVDYQQGTKPIFFIKCRGSQTKQKKSARTKLKKWCNCRE